MRKYHGLHLSEDLCQYEVRVFPSKKLEDLFITEAPLYYTLIVLVIFLFTAAVFMVYSILVE